MQDPPVALAPWCRQSGVRREAASEPGAPFLCLPFSPQRTSLGQLGLIFSLQFRFGTWPFSLVQIGAYRVAP